MVQGPVTSARRLCGEAPVVRAGTGVRELPQSGDAARAGDAHLRCRDRAGAAVTPFGLPGQNQSGLDPQGLSRVRLPRGRKHLARLFHSSPVVRAQFQPNNSGDASDLLTGH